MAGSYTKHSTRTRGILPQFTLSARMHVLIPAVRQADWSRVACTSCTVGCSSALGFGSSRSRSDSRTTVCSEYLGVCKCKTCKHARTTWTQPNLSAPWQAQCQRDGKHTRPVVRRHLGTANQTCTAKCVRARCKSSPTTQELSERSIAAHVANPEREIK